MKWRCLIVDDEPLAVRIVRKHAELVDHLEVVACCSDALQAMEVMKAERIDLIFLDIELPKILGTNFVRTLQKPPKIIFTTAHTTYAAEAFDLNAVDYLVKPITFERFLKAIDKAGHLMGIQQQAVSAPGAEFLYFRAERKMVKVLLADIQYVESIKDYINIFRCGLPPLHVKQSIRVMETLLPGNLFVRIHRSYIISIHQATAFTCHDVEIGPIELPIGRQYAAAIQRFARNNPGKQVTRVYLH
jgi:DNA-binding LytR/AlgR family response regulator